MKSLDKWLKSFISLVLLFILFLLPITIKGWSKNFAVYIHALDALAYLELTTIKNFVNDPGTTRSLPTVKDIKKYLHDFTWNNGLVVKGGVNWTEPWMKLQAEKMTNNPIAAYSLISRTNKYWPRIFNHSGQVRVRKEAEEELAGHVTIDNSNWPNEEDLEEAFDGILLSAFTYELNISELAVGKIKGVSTGFRLTSDQCADLSWWAHKLNYLALAIEWLEEAIILKKMKEPKKSTEKLEKKLQRYMQKHDEDMEIYVLEEPPQFFEHSTEYYKMCEDPTSFSRVTMDCPPRKRKSFECDMINTPAKLIQPSVADCYFATICSGQSYQTEEQKASLFCWYESNPPYLRIGPMKMEFLSQNPDIVQIYNAIGDDMINKVLAHAHTKLGRAVTGTQERVNRTEKTLHNKTSRLVYRQMRRYAMNAWVVISDKNETADLLNIPKTVQSITGLDTLQPNSSEPLQVASYTFSGYYMGHNDAVGNGMFPSKPMMGDRLATFMYYLSDVELGGNTAFLAAGVAARPVKGSAVFWYNTYGNGSKNVGMIHAACPVMLGRKFVANEWIHYTNQFQHRPCLVNQNELLRIPVNGKISP